MVQQVLAGLAHGIARSEILAFVTNQKLLDQVAGILGELQRIVVPRQQRRLVEAERVLEVSAARQQLRGAFDEFAQYQARRYHHLGPVHGRVQFDAADAKSIEERIEEVFGCYVHRLVGRRGIVGRQVEDLRFFELLRLRLGLLLLLAEQHRLEFVVASNLVLVEQLHAGFQYLLIDKLFEMVGRD